ncbi:MAG: adenosylcobinamide-GDP ribazoletransferase [Gammaproteobacteria bacterium]
MLAALAGVLLSGLWWLLALGLARIDLYRRASKLMLQRLGGTTGDTAGALIEMLECALLLGCVWTI